MLGRFLRLQFLFALILLFCASARADKLDDFMRAELRERHIPGAAIAVIKNGKLIKAEGYGAASVEFNVPATKDTVFEIGSVTKQLTAAAIMLLVEDGKISLDEKIAKYLPDTPASWQNVTVRHLLTHTSGIKSYTYLSGFELTKRLKRDDFIKKLHAEPLEFEPGARWNYSNSGYNLLGFIIESVSGKSYWDFMRERVFSPLGMTATADRDPQFIIKNRAVGYEWENNRLVGRDYDLTDVFSAGAVVSTVADLAKWDAALRDAKLLKKESLRQMWTPHLLNDGKTYPYGFGFGVADFRGHKLISHNGQTAGFAANISRFVDDDLSIIVLTNLGDQGLGGAIARGAAKIFLPDISIRAMREKPNHDNATKAKLETALRSYLNGKPDADLFAEDARKNLTTERAQETARRIASRGAIKNFALVADETTDGKQIYRCKIETPQRLTLWRFEVSQDGKIAALVLEEEE